MIKETAYNKKYLRDVINGLERLAELSPPETTGDYKALWDGLHDGVKNYLDYMDKTESRKGTTTSARKAAASAANGKKGGRPKGSKNKPKDAAMDENLEALRSLPHAKHDDQADALALTAYMAKDAAKGV